jgi:DNA-binding response OmpR family regulator
MNGYEYLEELREQKTYDHIPIVIFTTSSSQEDLERVKKFGIASYLVKPTDVEVLKNKIREILDKAMPRSSH